MLRRHNDIVAVAVATRGVKLREKRHRALYQVRDKVKDEFSKEQDEALERAMKHALERRGIKSRG